jgi:Protein of unknown function (DUF2950)
MLLMATEIPPISSGDAVQVARAVLVVPEDPVELVVWAALVVPVVPVASVARAELVVPVVPVELAVPAGSAVPDVLEASVARAELVVLENPAELAVQGALVVPENPAVRVVLVVPAVQVVPENPGAPVELIVPVEAVLVQDHPPVLLAVALRIKSVIAAHHPDQVLLLAVEEDLAAAAAETTREPAAAEVVIAWAAADTAAVVAEAAVTERAAEEEDVAVVAEDAAVAAEDAEDKGTSMRIKPMKLKIDIMTSSKIAAIACAIVSFCSLGLDLQAAPTSKSDAASAPQPAQKQFDTPKQAADALVQVAANFDVAAAKEILGPDGEDLIASEDPVQDKNRAAEFAAKAKEKMSVETDKKNSNQAVVLVGNDNFPLPIPLVKQKGKWFFDTKVGREEILNRRIGGNELNAIQICRGFVESQHEYALEKHDGSKVNQYAQRIISSPGKQDGLAWQNADGTWGGPIGEEVAKALEQGYSERVQPYHGYYFKVLKGQGPDAPMGEMDFVVGGAMIGGFALAATPAEYRVTGVQTFIVGPDGVVYEKDLGPDTLKTFQSMDKYNPDKTWKVTEDDVEDDSEG